MQGMQETWENPLEEKMALQYSCLGNPMDSMAQGYSPKGRKEQTGLGN